MADSSGRGASPILAFLVGGLLVAVVALSLFVYSGGAPQSPRSMDVKMSLPTPSAPSLPSVPNPGPVPAPLPKPAG